MLPQSRVERMSALRVDWEPTRFGKGSQAFERLLARRGKTFAFATRFLPEAVRYRVRVLYAFCRTLDDLVDEGERGGCETVLRWRAWMAEGGPAPDGDLANAVGTLLAEVPELRDPITELVDALLDDANPRALQSEAELDAFCRGVAGTVGVAMALLLGVREPPALFAADMLGRAMQRTNVLRDVAEDRARGRIYIPQETLAAFGLRQEDLAIDRLRGVRRAAFEALLASEATKARRYYSRGLRGVAYLPSDCRWAITTAAYGYRAILDEVVRLGARILERRASTSSWTKLRLAVAAWRDLHLGEVR